MIPQYPTAVMAASPSVPIKHTHLEVPSQGLPAVRPQRSPSQRFPPTALFQGPSSRNASHNDLSSSQTEQPAFQRLPRAQAPPSLAGLSVRPSIVQSKPSILSEGSYNNSGSASHPLSRFISTNDSNIRPDDKDSTFHPDALWAEMQRTLADVELSALNHSASSHVFGAAHSRALEDLRTAQLGLAQAWARSEADEIGHAAKHGTDESDSDLDFHSSDVVGKATRLTSSPEKIKTNTPGNNHNNHTPPTPHPIPKGRRRSSSAASAEARDIEAETARDINLARRRREANDRYFQQVNRGVLDVVAELDKVAVAMRSVEREAREIWEERGDSSATEAILSDATGGTKQSKATGKSVEPQDVIDEDANGTVLERVRSRTPPADTSVDEFSDYLSDSPGTPKKPSVNWKAGS